MKICPNCSMPFTGKYGLLYCEQHGYHAVNDAGEIIPATIPTDEQISAYEAQQEKAAEIEDIKTELETAAVPETIEPVKEGSLSRLVINDKIVYTAAIIISISVITLALYGMYRKSKRAALCRN